MNALSGEQEAILNGFRNLPAHSGVLSANYQKAAEVENARKRAVHDEELANLHREMNSSITVKIDSLTNEINSLKKTDDDTRHVLIRMEEDILALKTPKKQFPWGELLITLIAMGVMYMCKTSKQLMISN